MVKLSFWYYLTHGREDKGVHIFLKGICPKVNVIARLKFELAYYDSAVQRFNHYTTRIPPKPQERNWISFKTETKQYYMDQLY